jgi:hypothetical protein
MNCRGNPLWLPEFEPGLGFHPVGVCHWQTPTRVYLPP